MPVLLRAGPDFDVAGATSDVAMIPGIVSVNESSTATGCGGCAAAAGAAAAAAVFGGGGPKSTVIHGYSIVKRVGVAPGHGSQPIHVCNLTLAIEKLWSSLGNVVLPKLWLKLLEPKGLRCRPIARNVRKALCTKHVSSLHD